MHNFSTSNIRRHLLALALASTPLMSAAQMAQSPLLTKSAAVEPNLVFMFDDSASMPATYIYQYGGTPGGLGMSGPGGTYTPSSPDVNRIYYDPRIRYKLRVDANGNDINVTTLGSSTQFNVYFYKKTAASTVASVWDNTGNSPSLTSSYFTTSYQPPSSSLVAGASTTTPYPNLARSATSSYPKWIGRTDCTSSSTVCTWAEELRNYSIWNANHSNRDLLAKTGIGLAFKTIGPTIRIGWGRINTLDNGTLDAGVALFDPATKARFYSWLYGINSNVGSTPNRLALDTVGKYFSRSDSDGPWGSTPRYQSTGSSNVSSPVSTEASNAHLSCRRSFAMLMTDGYYNDGAPAVGGNVDGNSGPVIVNPKGGTFQYNKAGTINTNDTSSNSFADVAQKYWMNDLRPDITNNVPSSTTNESFWQNMSFYAIGLGVIGTLPQTQTTINNLKAGSISWPAIVTNDPRAIDDMWHATLNGRGAVLTATDSDTLNSSVDTMMSAINKLTSSQSGVAVSTASLKTGTRKYTPEYTTGSWVGNVIARTLDPNTGTETGTAWQVQGTDASGLTYNGIPPYTARAIYVGNAATGGTRAVPFTLTAMTAAGLIGDMPAAARTSPMIDYLRGDASNEGDTGIYRTRENRLGDIVNSAPVFIKGMPNREQVDPSNSSSSYVMEVPASTSPLPGTGTLYSTYKTSLTGRSEGAIFVGANDGMLHAFRDGTPTTPGDGGKEIFAYVPRTVLPNIHKLSDKFYSHQYYVDGPNIETDAYWGGSWRQLVVGTTGAGGKAVYAMDVTTPTSLDASKILWEVNDNVTGFSNLGYVLTDVQSGPLKNDVWAGIFGNGYESSSGTASLFIVNLETGALVREITTPALTGGSWSATVGTTTTTYKNALGGVRLIRDSNEQRVVGAYAGDLRGNVWRFDLSDSNPSNWTVSLMFSTGYVTPTTSVPTGYPKPITAAPQVVPHPLGGRMVVVGTGKFFENADVPAPYSTQSLYGLRDKIDFGSTFPTADYPVATTSLVTRVLSYIPSTTYLQITDTSNNVPGLIDWTSNMGWKIDLPFDGQRLVYPIEKLSNRNSRVLSFGTISPSNISSDACSQSGSGTGWDFFIDGLYGGDPSRAPDVDSSTWFKAISSYSGFSIGVQGKADGRNTTVLIESKSNDSQKTFATLSGGSSGSIITSFNCAVLGNCKKPPPVTPSTIQSREWRQLFLR